MRRLLLLACFLPACAGINAERSRVRKNDLLLRAAFDLGCPKDQLSVQQLNADTDWLYQAGVTGCGHKGSYVLTNNGWILNALDGSVGPAQPGVKN